MCWIAIHGSWPPESARLYQYYVGQLTSRDAAQLDLLCFRGAGVIGFWELLETAAIECAGSVNHADHVADAAFLGLIKPFRACSELKFCFCGHAGSLRYVQAELQNARWAMLGAAGVLLTSVSGCSSNFSSSSSRHQQR
jgi:hypothetical protein